MNTKMQEDYIRLLEKKNRHKLIVIFILSILLAACVVFLFTQFEFVIEDTTEISYDVDQDSGEGGSNDAMLDMSEDETADPFAMMCGTAIVCTLIIMGGIIIHGKTKNKSPHKENSQNNNSKKEREEEVNE